MIDQLNDFVNLVNNCNVNNNDNDNVNQSIPTSSVQDQTTTTTATQNEQQPPPPSEPTIYWNEQSKSCRFLSFLFSHFIHTLELFVDEEAFLQEIELQNLFANTLLNDDFPDEADFTCLGLDQLQLNYPSVNNAHTTTITTSTAPANQESTPGQQNNQTNQQQVNNSDFIHLVFIFFILI